MLPGSHTGDGTRARLCLTFALVLCSTLVAVVAPLLANDTVPTIAPGDQQLTGLKLQPYHARYRETRAGEIIGERLELLQEARFAQGAGFRFSIAMLRSGTVYDEIFFLKDTLEPVQRSVSSLEILHKSVVWGDGTVRGVQMAKDGSTPSPIEIASNGQRFAGSPPVGALLSLPLAPGYRARFPVFSTDVPEPLTNTLFQTIEVLEQRRVTVAGTEYDAWIVEQGMTNGDGEALMPGATVWITDVPPYSLVRIQGENRVELIAVSK